MSTDAFLADLREHRLTAYRAMPADIREHHALEAEIAQNYRGRFVYELLQNADDAMADGGLDDAVRLVLTRDALLVANSGRPISDADVASLCGVSVSTKAVEGRKRASIGHKGMGFKSVLELTDQPSVYSTDHSFRFSRTASADLLVERFGDGILRAPSRAPAMRLPFPVEGIPAPVEQLLADGMQTVFRFPLASPADAQRVARILGRMDARAILFLRRLERVEILQDLGETRHTHWRVTRESQGDEGAWTPVGVLPGTGMARVKVEDDLQVRTFAMFVRSDIEIADHRLGIEGSSWSDVELTEAAVALPIDPATGHLLPSVRDPRFHVFLATGERSPFPFLVNGAFNSDLSRQSIRCTDERRNYNRFLIEHVAGIVRDQVLPFARAQGQPAHEILRFLDRERVQDESGVAVQPDTPAPRALVQALRVALRNVSFLPISEETTSSVAQVAVFPPFSRDPALGTAIRQAMDGTLMVEGRFVPDATLCDSVAGRVLLDLGATPIAVTDLPALLVRMPTAHKGLLERGSGGLFTDPQLDLVTRIWSELVSDEDKREFRDAIQQRPLFPTGTTRPDGTLNHIATEGLGCFYPPRSLKGQVPLEGLCFLSREVCWGDMAPKQRNETLSAEMVAWQAIWDVREFKFPEVMRKAVLPRLALDQPEGQRDPLKQLDVLAAICQLAGRTPDARSPLPFERLGSNRALFALSRLPVPCITADGAEVWVPAFSAYFGRDWIGEESVEELFTGVDAAAVDDVPPVHYLVEPARFHGLLERLSHVREESATAPVEDDLGDATDEEDDEAALGDQEHALWQQFFSWLGVNDCLRPVAFHDVQEIGGGWLRTQGFRRPQGRWCQALPEAKWVAYTASLERALESVDQPDGARRYIVRMHDLEHLHTLQRWIVEGEVPGLDERLFRHIALHWGRLSRIAPAVLAVVPGDRVPGLRTKPPRPYSDEIHEIGEDFWVWRLRDQPWCPTVHGPRWLRHAWVPGAEVRRRFQPARLRELGQFLIPTLPSTCADAVRQRRAMSDLLGLRQELNQSSFRPSDAAIAARQLAALFDDRHGRLTRADLRDIIRPTYRHLFELMPATRREGGAWRDARQAVADVPLLEHDGRGNHRFTPASEVVYAARRDTRDRLGDHGPLWTFVLEGERAARARLSQFFGARSLEEIVHWTFEAGERALLEPEVVTFRERLRHHAAFLLCMLELDRTGADQIQRDTSRMRDFIDRVEPIHSLRVAFALTVGAPLTPMRSRSHFVSRDRATVMLVWDEAPWPTPLGEREATALAAALCEYLEVNQQLQFTALLTTPDDDARERVLRRAGAPHGQDREDKLATLVQRIGPGTAPSDDVSLGLDQTLPTHDDQEQQPPPPELGVHGDDDPHVEPHPLYQLDQLLLGGEPVLIQGEPANDGAGSRPPGIRSGGEHRRDGGTSGSTARPQQRTDRDALDILGMHVALRFEALRVARGAGVPESVPTDATRRPPDDRVFDVSSPRDIDRARSASPRFAEAYDDLVASHGLNRHYPGFDILTLDTSGQVERCIELKSSGVAARVQEMTWNEWKVSSDSGLSERFYLYLIGNLRSDIPGATPFDRTIRDPVSQLRADVTVEQRTQQKVQLRVDRFREAEELVLTVKLPGIGSGN